jgi:putative DNA primase/helicase
VNVKRAERLDGPVSLFLLTIADSGERKSTCDGFFMKAIQEFEAAQAEAAKPILRAHAAAMEAWEVKCNGVKDLIKALVKDSKATDGMEEKRRKLEAERPVPPKIPRLLYNDATPEALAYGLAKSWPSCGVVSAEGGIVFGSHGMGKDSVLRSLSTMNMLWDGSNLTVDRRTMESFTVRGARLTVALQVQEPILRDFITRTGSLARGTGFLSRFLIAWPESTQGSRPFTEAPLSWPHLTVFNNRIAEILELPVAIGDDGALTPETMMLTPTAKEEWIAYHNVVESELAQGRRLQDVRDVASKSADNAARLAALFQVFEHGDGGNITPECITAAKRVAGWHLNESRRFLSEWAMPPELAGAVRLDDWLIKHCRQQQVERVSIGTIQKFGPSELRGKHQLESALRELEGLDRVRRETGPGKARNLRVNPALLHSATAVIATFAIIGGF